MNHMGVIKYLSVAVKSLKRQRGIKKQFCTQYTLNSRYYVCEGAFKVLLYALWYCQDSYKILTVSHSKM